MDTDRSVRQFPRGSPNEPGPARRRTVLALCWAVLTIEGYDIVVFGASVPHLLQYQPWSLSRGDVGVLGSATLVGMLLGALLAGPLADRRGRRPALLTGVVVVTGGMVMCSAASTPMLFGVGRFLVGLGAGIVLPPAAALIAEYAPPGRRNLYQGITFGGIGFGGLLSALAAIALADVGDFRLLFLVGVLPPLILMPALLRWLPEPAEYLHARERSGAGPSGFGSWRPLFSPGYATRTVLFWSTTFLSLMLLFGVYTWLPSLMGRAGYSIGTSLAFLLILNLGVVIGSFSAPWLADRFGGRKVIFASFGSAATGFALLAQQPPVAVAYVLVAMVGAGAVNAQFLVNALIAASYPTEVRGTALGAALGLGRLGGVLGPMYGSWLLAGGISATAGFYGFVVPALLAALFSVGISVPGPTSVSTTTGVGEETVL